MVAKLELPTELVETALQIESLADRSHLVANTDQSFPQVRRFCCATRGWSTSTI
jgi:hypothetical protein